MKLDTGDIIFTSKDSLIVKFMDLFQKDPVRWGHCLLVKNSSSAFEAKNSVRLVSLSEVFKRKRSKKYKIIRYKKLTNKDKSILIEACNTVVGKPYSWKRIFLQFLDHIFFTNKFSRMDKSFRNQVCSSLVAWSYSFVEIKFNNIDWFSCEPDDIDDHYINNMEGWKLLEKN